MGGNSFVCLGYRITRRRITRGNKLVCSRYFTIHNCVVLVDSDGSSQSSLRHFVNTAQVRFHDKFVLSKLSSLLVRLPVAILYLAAYLYNHHHGVVELLPLQKLMCVTAPSPRRYTHVRTTSAMLMSTVSMELTPSPKMSARPEVNTSLLWISIKSPRLTLMSITPIE